MEKVYDPDFVELFLRPDLLRNAKITQGYYPDCRQCTWRSLYQTL